MKKQRSQSSTKVMDKVPLVFLMCLLPALLFPEMVGASKSSAPVKKDAQAQETDESHQKSDDGHHKRWRDDDSDGEHHRRRHGRGERHHGRKGNWGDKDESGNGHRRKLHSLDDDYKMEQIWKLPGLSDKQRAKLVDIERNFYIEVRPMRKQLKGIKDELEEANVQFTGDASGEIGSAVMSGSAKFNSDPSRDPVKTLEQHAPGNLLTGSGGKKSSKKANAEQTKKWYHSDRIEDDDGKEPAYKSARNSALYNRMKELKRKMKATKEKAWVEIRTVLTDKQRAVLAKQ